MTSSNKSTATQGPNMFVQEAVGTIVQRRYKGRTFDYLVESKLLAASCSQAGQFWAASWYLPTSGGTSGLTQPCCPLLLLLLALGPKGLVGSGCCRGGVGHKQVTKRSTHARPGMHMQQCSAVPETHLSGTFRMRQLGGFWHFSPGFLNSLSDAP